MSPAFATVLCVVLLPLLVFLPVRWLSCWLDRRDRIPEDVWAEYRALTARRILAQICRDRFGWFIVTLETRLVLFTEAPVVRGWSRGSGSCTPRRRARSSTTGRGSGPGCAIPPSRSRPASSVFGDEIESVAG
jgi:hypothetical protein